MNALSIKNLGKGYGDFALKDITLALPKGCILGLVGENGAGKTTIIRLILGMIRADEGSIEVLGKDNTEAGFELARGEIGVVLDESCLPDELNARQLSRVFRALYDHWSDETFFQYVKRFSLPEEKTVKEYSRGMRMKLAIAAALSHGAKLLVLDEATSGLDPVVRDEILDMLVDFTRDAEHAILISSHIVSDLEKLCDYIAFIHKGRLLFCDEKDALLDRFALVRCSKADFEAIDPRAVKGRRLSQYGVEALIERDAVPDGIMYDKPCIEDVIVYLSKGERES